MWKDIVPILPWIFSATALGYAVYVTFHFSRKKGGRCVNIEIQKDCPKVVHSLDIEDLGNKAVFCRCWRSKKFPYCDGSHAKHNELTGDNVGPLILKQKDA